MKKVLIWNLFLLMSALSSAAFANEGGVGSGGGGTTNPNPADPEWVVSASQEYGAKIITAWLRQEEETFEALPADVQPNSDYVKFFRPTNGKNIYQLLGSAEVEYRMHQPCVDSDGNPADGSIYGTRPGSICLSPFRMGPKLNEFNVQAETLALLVHEFGHLVGMNEAEAVKVQMSALYSFMHLDMIDVVVAIDLLAGSKFGPSGPTDLSMLMTRISLVQSELQTSAAGRNSFDEVQHGLLDLRTKVSERFRGLNFVRPRTLRFITANMERVMAVEEMACALTNRDGADMAQFCREGMERGFAGQDKVSAGLYMARSSRVPMPQEGDESLEIELTRANAQPDLAPQMDQLRAFLVELNTELSALQSLVFKGYRTN